jgi:hypothetical protein
MARRGRFWSYLSFVLSRDVVTNSKLANTAIPRILSRCLVSDCTCLYPSIFATFFSLTALWASHSLLFHRTLKYCPLTVPFRSTQESLKRRPIRSRFAPRTWAMHHLVILGSPSIFTATHRPSTIPRSRTTPRTDHAGFTIR